MVLCFPGSQELDTCAAHLCTLDGTWWVCVCCVCPVELWGKRGMLAKPKAPEGLGWGGLTDLGTEKEGSKET